MSPVVTIQSDLVLWSWALEDVFSPLRQSTLADPCVVRIRATVSFMCPNRSAHVLCLTLRSFDLVVMIVDTLELNSAMVLSHRGDMRSAPRSLEPSVHLCKKRFDVRSRSHRRKEAILDETVQRLNEEVIDARDKLSKTP